MITKPQGAPIVMCKECTDPQAAMLAPEAAAIVAGVTLRTLFRWIEAGKVHFLEQTDGTVLICSDSLHGESAARALSPMV